MTYEEENYLAGTVCEGMSCTYIPKLKGDYQRLKNYLLKLKKKSYMKTYPWLKKNIDSGKIVLIHADSCLVTKDIETYQHYGFKVYICSHADYKRFKKYYGGEL